MEEAGPNKSQMVVNYSSTYTQLVIQQVVGCMVRSMDTKENHVATKALMTKPLEQILIKK